MKDLPLTLTSAELKPARICTITRRDGTTYRVTDAQTAVTIDSNTWSPLAGFTLGAIKHTSGGAAASTQIDIVHSDGGTFDTGDINAGRFDSASVVVGVVNRSSLASIGTYFTGTMQSCTFTSNGSASFDVLGLAMENIGIITQKYQPMCRVDLGSTLCHVPILPWGTWFLEETPRSTAVALGLYARHRFASTGEPDDYRNRYLEVTTAGTTAGSVPSFSSTIDATTSDGSAVWTTRNAWTRHGRVSAIVNQHTIILIENPDVDRGVDGWFNQGFFVMRSGESEGWAFEIGSWDGDSLTLGTYLPVGEMIAPGDLMEISPGCAKTLDDDGCPKFSNQLNYQGEAHYEGARAAAAVQS